VAGYLWLAAGLVRRRDALRTAAPWLALGAYAIASAIMASAARTRFGAEHALDSRYTTVSVILVVSLIGLLASMTTPSCKAALSPPRQTNLLAGLAVGILLILYTINVPPELRYLRLHHSFRVRGKGALEFSSVLDLEQMCRANLMIRQDPPALADCLRVLDRLKLLDPPRRQTALLEDAEDRPKRATDELGFFEKITFESADVLVASGWSYLRDDGLPPAGVLLAYRDGETWKAFALSEVAQHRSDLATRFKRKGYVDAGWSYSFSRNLLPLGEQEISAWALEANHGRTYRLPGSFKLQR